MGKATNPKPKKGAGAKPESPIVIQPGATELEVLAVKAARRQLDVIQVDGKRTPTPEQMAHGTFGPDAETVDTGKGIPAGRAYRRHPMFETLAKTLVEKIGARSLPLLTGDDVEAMRRYRRAYDACQSSETRSCLDVGERVSRSATAAEPSLRPAFAASDLTFYEGGVPTALLPVLRSVVLEDLTFTDVAIGRYGFRVRRWIENGKHLEKAVLISNTHRTNVRDEFLTAVRALTRRLLPLISTAA